MDHKVATVMLSVWSAFCASSVQAQANTPSPMQSFQIRNERLQLTPASRTLRPAQDNEIPVILNGKQIRRVHVSWRPAASEIQFLPTSKDDVEVSIKYKADGSSYISVTPTRLGKLQLTVSVTFEDGSLARQTLDFEVVPPKEPPDRIIVSYGGGDDTRNVTALFLGINAPPRQIGLSAGAFYPGMVDPVLIQPKFVRYVILGPKDEEPAIRIDSVSGIVSAVHLGHALIETRFEGLRSFTCVTVMENPSIGHRFDCQELRPSYAGPAPSDGSKIPGLPVTKASPR